MLVLVSSADTLPAFLSLLSLSPFTLHHVFCPWLSTTHLRKRSGFKGWYPFIFNSATTISAIFSQASFSWKHYGYIVARDRYLHPRRLVPAHASHLRCPSCRPASATP